jgi:hypothetical protein
MSANNTADNQCVMKKKNLGWQYESLAAQSIQCGFLIQSDAVPRRQFAKNIHSLHRLQLEECCWKECDSHMKILPQMTEEIPD